MYFVIFYCRHIVVKPINMEWCLIPYNDYKIPLFLNDYELLTSKEVLESPINKEGKFKALKLRFTLPPSSYATSALREILSSESSFEVQCGLNSAVLETETN